jgi:mannitol/fructose-specific phosphotransferase system IIA component (Ntr-type)
MESSSRTPEGCPNCCPVCGTEAVIEPSTPFHDAPCPSCGHLLWFGSASGNEFLGFLPCAAVLTPMDVSTREEAIETLVTRLADLGYLPADSLETVIDAVMKQEEQASTGIGKGVAVPHTKHVLIPRVVGGFGHVPAGIDFNSLDGEPVTNVFLVLSPPDQPGDHLRALEHIARIARALP